MNIYTYIHTCMYVHIIHDVHTFVYIYIHMMYVIIKISIDQGLQNSKMQRICSGQKRSLDQGKNFLEMLGMHLGPQSFRNRLDELRASS